MASKLERDNINKLQHINNRKPSCFREWFDNKRHKRILIKEIRWVRRLSGNYNRKINYKEE